jgi:hypothetical protein
MRIKLLITFFFILFLTGTLFALDRNRKIVPVSANVHAVLTKSLYNQTIDLDATSRRLVYISYVSGFVDAMQLNSTDNGVAKKFLEDCKNLTLGDLIDTMYNFRKDENCKWKDVTPAVILTVVVPRLKKGLSPFPGSE